MKMLIFERGIWQYHDMAGDLINAIKEKQQRIIILKREIFDYIQDGDELVREPFHRLLREGRLTAYEYDDFWMAMDTFKDRQQLEEIYAGGQAPWELWNGKRPAVSPTYAVASV